MGGIMWGLRWLAAIAIFANCIVMTVDAALESRSFELTQLKPLVTTPLEVR
jgi:hypothetical protein